MTVDVSPLWQGSETLVPAALRGYRAWRVMDSKLYSTGVRHEWEGAEVSARCLQSPWSGGREPDCPCDLCARNNHAPPVRDCQCGIYGWYDPKDSRLVQGDVFGAVEVTGRAVLASHGFRAEKARIVALAIEEPRDPYRSAMALSLAMSMSLDRPTVSASELHDIARWAKTQDIPVFPTRDEMVAEYPPQSVEGLVQHQCDPTCSAHREYGAEQRIRTYTRSLHTSAPSYLTSSMGSATLTASSLYSAAGIEPAATAPTKPSCPRKRMHVALVVIAVIGWIFGAVSSSQGSWVGAVGVVTNGALLGYWGRHCWTYHRRKR